MKVCVLGDHKHCEDAKELGIDAMSVEDLKKLNKNKKLVKKLGELLCYEQPFGCFVTRNNAYFTQQATHLLGATSEYSMDIMRVTMLHLGEQPEGIGTWLARMWFMQWMKGMGANQSGVAGQNRLAHTLPNFMCQGFSCMS